MTERELLRRHIEAVWDLNLPPLDETLTEQVLERVNPPWSLYMATFGGRQMALWHPGVAPEERHLLLERARTADAVWDQATGMRREVVFSAPSIRARHQADAQLLMRVLSPDDTDLINAFEEGAAPIFLKPRNAPCVGVLVNGRIVTIAHSSRQTPFACELGIDTLPDARRRGYATAATVLWTALIQQKGLIPIYSAFAWNTASLQLASVAGYARVIDGAYGPTTDAGYHAKGKVA